MPVIGFLNPGTLEAFAYLVAPFRQGLNEAGYVEDQNVRIEYRWAAGRNDQLPTLAAELVRRQVSVIAATGGSISARSAKAATATIPIVFNVGDDPIKLGLVASLNRPGGNLTGVSAVSSALEPKRLGLLRELVPQAAVIAVLLNPTNPDAELQARDVKAAATAIGWQLHILNPSRESDFEAAFGAVIQYRADALLVANDAFFNSQREQIVALAARHAIPVMYSPRSFPEAGGLMSYSTSLTEVYRIVGIYTGMILKGAKPADLPVQQPTKFELVINHKTARALGLKVSDNLLSLAGEVIE
jgi:putative ABC transport system substrate-binding protein